LDEAIYIHKTIGPGMLENVYKTCLAYRLIKRGLFVEVEKAVPVLFEEIKMECGYRADIVVERSVVVDTKSIEGIGPIQIAQVLTYLRFLKIRYGLILNFNAVLMKDGIKEYLMDMKSNRGTHRCLTWFVRIDFWSTTNTKNAQRSTKSL
jgi:GxxExxY protein